MTNQFIFIVLVPQSIHVQVQKLTLSRQCRLETQYLFGHGAGPIDTEAWPGRQLATRSDLRQVLSECYRSLSKWSVVERRRSHFHRLTFSCSRLAAWASYIVDINGLLSFSPPNHHFFPSSMTVILSPTPPPSLSCTLSLAAFPSCCCCFFTEVVKLWKINWGGLSRINCLVQ